ncbi:MAG: HtaA domain-containing protein [Patulibacter sp.]|nr:HtaA domain-containing protein [Patulibacter sp.]
MRKTARRAASGAALIALTAAGLGAASPAGAATASGSVAVREGSTTVRPAGAAYRTLRRSKVKLSTLGDAKRTKSGTKIPVTGGKAAKSSELRHANVDGLVLRRGSDRVRVTGLRIRLNGKKSRVTGRIDGKKSRTLFTMSATRLKIDSKGGSAQTATRSWKLTASAARTLGRELGVKRLRKGTFARVSSKVKLAVPGAANVAPGAPAPTPGPGGGPPAPTPPVNIVGCPVLPGADATQTRVLDWGLRQSFRNYVSSDGSIVPSNGAAASPGGTFLFGVSSVTSYDAQGALSAAFRGAVYFEKWGTGEAASLRLWLCNPRIEAPSSGVGSLYVDMLSKRLDTGQVVAYPNVRLADIDMGSGTRGLVGGAVRWAGVQTTLTAAGVEAFAGFYTAGEALDPLTLTVAVP